MSRIMRGDVLFGLFMVLVFVAGAYDLFSQGDWDAIWSDSGMVFALFIIGLSVLLLLVVMALAFLQKQDDKTFMGRRGLVIGLLALFYPILFWAAEYLIATTLVGFLALGLFMEHFGRKQFSIALIFAAISYLIFFFLLGITEPEGAFISTGLHDLMPIWRRDLFEAI